MFSGQKTHKSNLLCPENISCVLLICANVTKGAHTMKESKITALHERLSVDDQPSGESYSIKNPVVCEVSVSSFHICFRRKKFQKQTHVIRQVFQRRFQILVWLAFLDKPTVNGVFFMSAALCRT